MDIIWSAIPQSSSRKVVESRSFGNKYMKLIHASTLIKIWELLLIHIDDLNYMINKQLCIFSQQNWNLMV